MGWKFEVSNWLEDFQGYSYCHVYGGESFFAALWIMWKLKRMGFKCVKLEWR